MQSLGLGVKDLGLGKVHGEACFAARFCRALEAC